MSDSAPDKDEVLDDIEQLLEDQGASADDAVCVRDYLDTNGYLDDLSTIQGAGSFDLAAGDAIPPEAQNFVEGFILAMDQCLSPEDLEDLGSPDDAPSAYGSHPGLDLLYDGCESGSVTDCDILFAVSPSPSEYQDFALACGGLNEPSEPSDSFCFQLHGAFNEIDGVQGQCEQGFFPACELLFLVTEVGSAEEAVATTCGDRREPNEVFPCWAEFGFGSR